MSTSNDWNYWLKLKYWNKTEAICAIYGIVPNEYNIHQIYELTGECLHPEFQKIALALKREFKEENNKPEEYLKWAKKIDIVLDEDLIRAMNGETESSTTDKKSNERGKHFAERRNIIFSVALHILNEETKFSTDLQPIRKKSGAIHIENLADAVTNTLEDMNQADKSIPVYVVKTINDWLSDAINLKYSTKQKSSE